MKKYVALMITVSLATCGCSTSGLMKTSTSLLTSPISALVGARQQPVAKILCLWEPAEGQGLDEKPSRGFAGQIMFFGYGQPEPIPVHGTVRIFEYADFDNEDDDPQPIHTFVFNDGGWNAHRAEGTLGQSYNVFLPYVQKKSGHVVCALRVEFESADGKVVSSPFTEVTLAAKTSHKPASEMRRNIVTQHTNDSASDGKPGKSEETENVPKKLDSMTITLPGGGRGR